VIRVTDLSSDAHAHEIVCPHCKKTFTAELLGGETQRHRGFKCPHCKLFVPADRTRQP
jgi:transposase-like protein